MSISNASVTPIHNGTTCVDMINVMQNECMCVLKDIVDVKQRLDKDLTSFIRRGIQASYYTSLWQILLRTLYSNF